MDKEKIARDYLAAYERDDRESLEKCLHDNFYFISPVDDAIDRQTYFNRCWPNHERIQGYEIKDTFVTKRVVVIRYFCYTKSGNQFENMEYLKIRDNQITSIRVYFGFDLNKDPFLEKEE